MKAITRNERIIGLYKAKYSTYEIAHEFNLTSRQVQRIINHAGIMRSKSESFKIAIEKGRMTYHHTPEHLKKKRKRLTDKVRFKVLEAAGYRCKLCGCTANEGYRIEIDHIDNDATHNELSNLQVLCSRCNKGKAWASRTPSQAA